MIQIITILFISAVIGIWTADKLAQFLPELHVLFDRRPFNCRPCLSFHLTWISVGGFACLFNSFVLFFGGIATAFVVYLVVKYFDNKIIQK